MIKSKETQSQEVINTSYKKLAIVMVVTLSVLVAVIGTWQMPRAQDDGGGKAALPKEKSAEEIIAERVPRGPPRAPEENPTSGGLARESAGPSVGVEMKLPPPPPPVKITRAPVRPPTVEMMAVVAPKGSTPTLAVDAEGYATLPDGQRVKVKASSASAPAFAAPTAKEASP